MVDGPAGCGNADLTSRTCWPWRARAAEEGATARTGRGGVCAGAGVPLANLQQVSPTDGDRVDGRNLRWDRHRAERRTHILQAAVAVIEECPPGTEVNVRQIAERAGVGRPVIYRHFADRADLDRAIQGHVLTRLRDELVPAVELSGSVDEIIRRIVSRYVGWAAAHPSLHELGLREPADLRASELYRVVKPLADMLAGLFTVGAELLDVELSEDDAAALDLLVFGLVGEVFGAVRLWLGRPTREPAPDVLAELLAQTIWFQVDGHARLRGLELDPTVPVEELFAARG